MTAAPFHIRRFRAGDELALHAVFHSAIHQIACKDYTPEQINAWAPDEWDHRAWIERMREIRPFVVEQGDRLVAYADIQPNGYIVHFFVSGSHARRGIGHTLMGRIHEFAATYGIVELTSDVSITAQPFFTRYGFKIVEQRFPVIRGVTVSNARMHKKFEN